MSNFFSNILRLKNLWISGPTFFNSITMEGKKSNFKKFMTYIKMRNMSISCHICIIRVCYIACLVCSWFNMPSVPMCLACFCAHTPTCLACLGCHITTCLACICSHVPMRLACFCAHVNVPCMLKCQRALHAYVLICWGVLHANVPHVLTCLHGNVASMLMCSCANMPYMLMYSYVNVPCMSMCSHARTSNNKNKFSMTCFTKIFDTFSCEIKLYMKSAQQAEMSLETFILIIQQCIPAFLLQSGSL